MDPALLIIQRNVKKEQDALTRMTLKWTADTNEWLASDERLRAEKVEFERRLDELNKRSDANQAELKKIKDLEKKKDEKRAWVAFLLGSMEYEASKLAVSIHPCDMSASKANQ